MFQVRNGLFPALRIGNISPQGHGFFSSLDPPVKSMLAGNTRFLDPHRQI